ncbi:hypothetical protein CBF27_00435 [Vagococcus acidifermentans]|uniref:TIGR02679 family protein n=2 Tax=Vagococcus acidifermentans TaxID=564710 RepID=A0A430B2C4_9ENTE|nr:hypothetical protein CBF27_00435 [Vagococcus acidifermentans]
MKMERELDDFFQAKISYRKVMDEAALKYYRYGKFTGTISLMKFTEIEQAEIADFLGCSFSDLNGKTKFQLKEWQRAFENSRFGSIAFTQAVEMVTGKPLQTKAEVESLEQERKNCFFELCSRYSSLAFITAQRQLDFYRQQVTEEELAILAQLVGHLPPNVMYLPVYAEQELGNPHGLDRGTRMGKLFYTLLNDAGQLTRETGESHTEYRSRVYNQQNLVVDDLMNFVTIGNLLGKTARHKIHPMWQGACDYQVIWNVPIKALLDIVEISPNTGEAVFIFENSSLYSALLTKFPDLPAICHQGQFRLAMWRLLELFPDTTRFFYASDMDPEGLQMADKVKMRYGERVHFMCMDASTYRNNLSEVSVSESLVKLDSLVDQGLQEIAEAMKVEQVASYQERLYGHYVEFITQAFVSASLNQSNF